MIEKVFDMIWDIFSKIDDNRKPNNEDVGGGVCPKCGAEYTKYTSCMCNYL